MSDGPEIPNDDELAKTLEAMDAAIGGPMVDPRAVKKEEPPEVAGRVAMLKAVKAAVTKTSEAARLAGFLFVSVAEDGVTPVLYSIQTMTGTTARLLLAELELLRSRIALNLNRAEDYLDDADLDDPTLDTDE